MSARGRPGGDRGAGSALVLAVVAGVAIVGLTLVAAATALGAAQRVSGAADAAALAAADVMLGWSAGDPCAVAERLARVHDTALHECWRDGVSMVVTVRARVLGM